MTAPDSSPEVAARPRKRDAARTKREILAVAGRRFAREGFSKVSLHQIASEVGVTAAMVIHHFGSKAGLFAAVARDEWGLEKAAHAVPSNPPAMAEHIVKYWADTDARSPSLALVRSLDDPNAVELFRTELDRRIVSVWWPALSGPDLDERLRLVAGLIMGFGYFTTGALLDPDAPPMAPEERAVMAKYLERMIEVLVHV